jgi:hypothetical protein
MIMKSNESASVSDLVRQHTSDVYLSPARRHREKRVSVNVGAVHKALRLGNRVPLVCTALGSKKFLKQNHLRLISKTGPPSGQSTTVTYTYELVDEQAAQRSQDSGRHKRSMDPMEAWKQLRGSLKDVYAEYGGGEAYLRAERDAFKDWDTRK